MTKKLLTALALTLLGAAPAHAERYRVDLIVFLDRSAPANESLASPRPPDGNNAWEPAETQRLRAAGIEILPDAQFGLGTEWQRLKNSRLHEPVLRVAWTQKDPPTEKGPGLRLRSGAAFAVPTSTGATSVYPVDGVVRLLAGRYLHVDADFAQTQRTSGGDLGAFRLREKRRLKRNELNHLDSPRLGILVKVTKADGTK